MNQLLPQCQIVNLITLTAGVAGTSVINSAVLDMSGFEGALIIVSIGTLTAGAVTSSKLQMGATNAPATDIAGSNITITQASDSNTLKCYDIRRPQLRYLRLVLSRATANAVVAAVAILYSKRDRPVIQAVADFIGQAASLNLLVSPAAGTP